VSQQVVCLPTYLVKKSWGDFQDFWHTGHLKRGGHYGLISV